jgi:signal transduction histidine kinase/CheY-like chemotaxis protein
MLVVMAVTSVTLYLAGRNLRATQQNALDAQFQNQVRTFLAVQEAQSGVIAEKCRALSHSVRLRAAFEEHDFDDLYRNALTELQGIFDTSTSEDIDPQSLRASFFRFFDADGVIVPPGEHPAGLTDQKALEDGLAPMGKMLRELDEQSVAFVALARGNNPRALREVVLTKIRDWKGRNLGTLVLGFPITHLEKTAANPATAINTGIWLNQQLYIDNLSAADRHLLVDRVGTAMARNGAGHIAVTLENGPHLLFYKALDPETRLSPAYQVCLYPLSAAMREAQTLRWKIIAFGLGVLLFGFAASLFLAKGLSKPVDRIVAGSIENLTRRKRAEHDLVEANRELEKALADLKATQQQVIQQERLSAIGQMASGIAHDFNNTLTPILGFAEVLLKNPSLLDNRQETVRCLEMLRTSAQDAANVVSRLREFYRPAETGEEFPIVDLARIVQQAVSLTEPKWRYQAQATGTTVRVVTEFTAMPTIAGEESALREVLTNLLFNAVDAMPQGGRISLETSIEDDKAVLRVSDTGTGMSETVRQRCLEPFFSTKGERGTGLGLSMVYGIIERHRGQLEIQSAIGKGTTFIIRIPLATEAPLPAAAEVAAEIKSKLNVLIVDDEPRVREVVSIYLRCDGHNVATAASGREALEKFRLQPFDLVILDRAMPEMNGEQTARFIKQINSDIPVIMLTGFGALIEVTGAQPQAVDVVLSKPITLDALRRTIDKVLYEAA